MRAGACLGGVNTHLSRVNTHLSKVNTHLSRVNTHLSRVNHLTVMESRRLGSRPKASARLDLEVAAAGASLSSRGPCDGDALPPSTGRYWKPKRLGLGWGRQKMGP
jgi:hypothetical protein